MFLEAPKKFARFAKLSQGLATLKLEATFFSPSHHQGTREELRGWQTFLMSKLCILPLPPSPSSERLGRLWKMPKKASKKTRSFQTRSKVSPPPFISPPKKGCHHFFGYKKGGCIKFLSAICFFYMEEGRKRRRGRKQHHFRIF